MKSNEDVEYTFLITQHKGYCENIRSRSRTTVFTNIFLLPPNNLLDNAEIIGCLDKISSSSIVQYTSTSIFE